MPFSISELWHTLWFVFGLYLCTQKCFTYNKMTTYVMGGNWEESGGNPKVWRDTCSGRAGEEASMSQSWTATAFVRCSWATEASITMLKYTPVSIRSYITHSQFEHQDNQVQLICHIFTKKKCVLEAITNHPILSFHFPVHDVMYKGRTSQTHSYRKNIYQDL